jgi:hypothetical protein
MKETKQHKLLKYSVESEPAGQVPRDSAAARTALLVQCSCCTTAILTRKTEEMGCVLNVLHFPYSVINLRVNCNKNRRVTTRPAAQITSNVLE